MKKFKKLVPAFCMLLLSAVMLASGTYAWFSVNDRVSATGMQVEAKSNQAFLLISSTNKTATEIQTENSITTPLTVSDEEAKVLPAAHETINKTDDAIITESVKNWYTAFGSDPSKPDMNTDTKTALTAFNGYVIHKQVWITVAKNSVAVKDLKVSAKIANKNSGTITQAKVLVTSVTAAAEMSIANIAPATVLAASIDDASVVELNIFIYVDGSNDAIYTNNINALDAATIELTFSATPVAE